MIHFRCVPITTDIAARFRSTGIDDNGNTIRRVAATAGGAPCRHCLRDAQAGDMMLLGSYNLLAPLGIYWTPSPIFVHADACARYDAADDVPEIVRTRLVSVRAYDRDDQCLYDLGQAVQGTAVDPFLTRAIGDARTKFVNIHTAKPGCLLCRMERV